MNEPQPGGNRVLWLSTIAFTLMFAVWLMFGILGKPIQQEFGLTEVQLSWIVAAAALNGSLWRLPRGVPGDARREGVSREADQEGQDEQHPVGLDA